MKKFFKIKKYNLPEEMQKIYVLIWKFFGSFSFLITINSSYVDTAWIDFFSLELQNNTADSFFSKFISINFFPITCNRIKSLLIKVILYSLYVFLLA